MSYLKSGLITAVVFAFTCVGLNADVLVYKWKQSGGQEVSSYNDGDTYDIARSNSKGFLVLDYDPATGVYQNAKLVRYWNGASGKVMRMENFLGDKAVFETWNFSGKDSVMVTGYNDDNRAEMYAGKSSVIPAASVGSINNFEVAKRLKGQAVWNRSSQQRIVQTGYGKVSLTVDIKNTRLANISGQTVDQVVDSLKNQVEAKGYVNQSPTAVDDVAETSINTAVNIRVLSNDSDPQGSNLTIQGIETEPLNGTATVNASGSITYTPDTNFYGNDYFTYEVANSYGSTASARVTVTVQYLTSSQIAKISNTSAGTASIVANIRTYNGRYAIYQQEKTGDTSSYAIFLYDRGELVEESIYDDASANYHGTYIQPAVRVATGDADCSVIAFSSESDKVVTNDTNGMSDVFILNRGTNTYSRVSVATGGAEANGESFGASISSDAAGQYVSFSSNATNLGAVAANNNYNVFLRDTVGATTGLISQSTATVEANGDCMNSSVSGDGRFVVFQSNATNLLDDYTNYTKDAAGNPENINGTYRQIYLRDRTNSETYLISRYAIPSVDPTSPDPVEYLTAADADCFNPVIVVSGTTGYISFHTAASNLLEAGDGNGYSDVYFYSFTIDDLLLDPSQQGNCLRVSQRLDGTEANGDSSYGSMTMLTTTNSMYIVYQSTADNLTDDNDLNGSNDIYMSIYAAGALRDPILISRNDSGVVGNNGSFYPTIGTNGNYIMTAFTSDADNFVAADTNGERDVFVVTSQKAK